MSGSLAPRSVGALIAVLVLSLAGCERTLIYGERSGFNVGFSVTPSENLPIEVNVGLKRRVVGIIPASGEPEDDKVTGEAVNMFSRFDVQYEPNTGIFFGTHTVSTAFASGAAATAIAGLTDPEPVVAAIVNPVEIRLDNSPEAKKVREALTGFIKSSKENVAQYLTIAKEVGIPLEQDEGLPPPLVALSAISKPTNASRNARVADQLDLLR